MHGLGSTSASNSIVGPGDQRESGTSRLAENVCGLSTSSIKWDDTAYVRAASTSARVIEKIRFNTRQCDFSGQDLSYKYCPGMDWFSARLTNANLSYSDLSHGKFCSANLEGANCTGVKWDHADLSTANLNGTRMVKLPPTVKIPGNTEKPFVLTVAKTPMTACIPLALPLPSEWNRDTLRYRLAIFVKQKTSEQEGEEEFCCGSLIWDVYAVVENRYSLLSQILDIESIDNRFQLACQLMHSIKESKTDTLCVSNSLLIFLENFFAKDSVSDWQVKFFFELTKKWNGNGQLYNLLTSSQLINVIKKSNVDRAKIAEALVTYKKQYDDIKYLFDCYQEIASQVLAKWGSDGLPLLSRQMFDWVYRYFIHNPEKMAEYSSAYLQYYVQGVSGKVIAARLDCENFGSIKPHFPEKVKKMMDLDSIYLKLKKVLPYTQGEDFERDKLHDLKQWNERLPMSPNPNLLNIILLPQTNSKYAIRMTRKVLEALTNRDEETYAKNLHNIWLYEEGENIGTATLDLRQTHAAHFPLLRWTDSSNKSIESTIDLTIDSEIEQETVRIIDSIIPQEKDLPQILKEKPNSLLNMVLEMANFDHAQRQEFEAVQLKKAHQNKLVSNRDQSKLVEIFTPNMCSYNLKSTLNEAHYQQLMKKIALHDCGNSNRSKAEALLCLSAVFVKYSSSAMFGSENESPLALRMYAYALLAKAVELDPAFLKDEVRDWQEHLIGNKFSCTSILFDKILQRLNFVALPMVTKIVPLDWRY